VALTDWQDARVNLFRVAAASETIVPSTAASILPDTKFNERRVDHRDKITLPAKIFVPSTAAEIDCTVTNLSPAGAGLDAPLPPVETEVVLYIEGFERFSGSVAWSTNTGGGIRFRCTAPKRARTAERLYSYISGEPGADTATRRTSRAPLPPVRELRRMTGELVPFEVIDISLDGAALRTQTRLGIGETVVIGLTEGRVTRYLDRGVAVEFTRRSAR
jgi:hypothetical protein